MEDTIGRKVILLGDTGVGKTWLLNKYLDPEKQIDVPATVSSQFEKVLVDDSNGNCVQLNVWDTAGQEIYRSIIQLYLRDVKIAFICFNYKEIESTTISEWCNLVLAYSPNCLLFLVATKIDLYSSDEKKAVQTFMENSMTKFKQFSHWFMTSAVSGDGINDLFSYAANVEIPTEGMPDPIPTGKDLQSNPNDKSQSNCC